MILDVKWDIIKLSKSGDYAVDIAHHIGLLPMTTCSILQKGDEISKKMKCTTQHPTLCCMLHFSPQFSNVFMITPQRSEAMEIMKCRLVMWLEDLHKKNTLISLALIQQKSISLYEEIKKEEGESSTATHCAKQETFSANRG